MSPTTAEQAVLNEAVWQAWIEKGKRREKAAARKFKLVAGVVLPLVVLGVAFYFLSMK